MHLEGTVSIQAPRQKVWDSLIDPYFVSQCAPGLESMEVIEPNKRFQAVAGAGFGSAALRAAHPRLITCDISGYGEEGPYREMRAYDMLVQAESGLASISGTPEAPGRVGVSICDLGTGMWAVQGIVAALYERERTGRGQLVECSLLETAIGFSSPP